MLRTIWRLLVSLAVLGGMIVALVFVLNQLKAHAPAPISTAAAAFERAMSPS